MESVYLKPFFSSNDIGKDLIFINCTLGYNGNINLLFADKIYNYLEPMTVKHYMPGSGETVIRTLIKFRIFPEAPQNYRLFVLEENRILELSNKNINYTHALQIDDDKYCFICHSKKDSFRKFIKKNCEIYNFHGKYIRKFDMGHGIIDIQTNSNKELWVSYSDSGIYNSDNNVGRAGLNCYDINGKYIYKYDDKSLSIDSCDSLNVYSDTELLVNIYCGNVESWFALSKITNRKPEKLFEWRYGTKYIAILDNKFLFQYCSSEDDENFTLVNNINEFYNKVILYEFLTRTKRG
jgi:hypothetical protein